MIPVLLLSNDINEIKSVSKICADNDFMFMFVDNKAQFTEILLKEKIVVSIINSRLCDQPTETIEHLRENGCNTSFIFIGDKSFENARKLLKSGFYDYLTFNYSKSELAQSLIEAVENVFTFEKIKSLSEDLEQTNQDLLKKTEELEKEKRNLNEHIATLNKIQKFIKEISLQRDIENIYKITLKYLSEKFSNRIILFSLIENFKEKILGAYNISFDTVKNLEFDLSDLKSSPWANTILNQKSKVFVENPLDDIWYSKSDIVSYFPYGFAKYPLVSRDNVFGCITMSLKPSDKQELIDNESFIFFLAEHIAIAIDNIQLQKALLNTIDDLKKTQKQLVENEKIATIGKFAVSVNHEINNPLCSISLNVELLKRNFCDTSNEQLAKIFDTLEKNIDKISRITNKISNMKKIVTKEYLPGIDMIDLDDN